MNKKSKNKKVLNKKKLNNKTFTKDIIKKQTSEKKVVKLYDKKKGKNTEHISVGNKAKIKVNKLDIQTVKNTLIKLIIKKKKIISLFLFTTIIVSILILAFPLLPKIIYTLKNKNINKIDYPISFPISYSIANKENLITSTNIKPVPLENRLIIPSIGVDSEILEGKNLDILLSKEGVWREPNSNNPIQLGNMVIAGHRFQYLPPNTDTFYNLPNIKIGSKIIIFWKKTIYIYEVINTLIVDPTDISIRNITPGISKELTLYTCTPLYTSEKRFVVQARLI